ncbi:MAG: 16S rRNA (guanine(527)-N(7))-methyltransferase RsmG [Clostridia bacterium]|nr:16S rRNA (guanine(527)-N(7))-methyltransferase RsmG [Clostridia bacterium]
MTETIIYDRLLKNEIPCSEELAGKLLIYFRLLTEWNGKMDLTAVTEEDETLDKHFADSLCVLKTGLLPPEGSMIDVGTGAGFPGLPIAMACPGLQLTLLDAQQKRLTFLDKVISETGLTNVRTVHARAEDGARQPQLRENFDIAAARAVAPLNVLCEYLLPYLRIGGKMICWKGPALNDELEAGGRAAAILGGRISASVRYEVAGRDWQHTLLVADKLARTAKTYPRKAGTPKSRPLG